MVVFAFACSHSPRKIGGWLILSDHQNQPGTADTYHICLLATLCVGYGALRKPVSDNRWVPGVGVLTFKIIPWVISGPTYLHSEFILSETLIVRPFGIWQIVGMISLRCTVSAMLCSLGITT